MKEISIFAKNRTGSGKGPARQARMAGNIPAIVYGPEREPASIQVKEADLRAALKAAAGESSIFTLDVEGKSSRVLVREIQRDPVSSRIEHIDFHAISMTKALHLSIPINFKGTAIGVKAEGGILTTQLRDLDISCLPANIPSHFEIDVSELGIGDSIHVRDITIPNVEILNDESATIVVVSAPTVVAAPTPAEGAAVEGAEATAEGAEGAAAGDAKDKDKEKDKDEKKDKK